MKESKFNTFIQKGKITLGYNSMGDNMVVLPTSVYDIFQNNKTNVVNIKNKDKKLYNVLIVNGFIIADDRDELSEIRLLNKLDTISSKNYHLTIIPSLDCNLKCWYCYESHRKGSKMSINVMDRVINHIKHKISNNELDNLIIDWFGGEPLLFFDEVTFPLSMRLKEILQDKKMTLNSFFVTNASLILDEHIPKLESINSRFQITLDGNRKRHNKIRCTKESNSGTYSHLIKTIYELSNRINNTFINVRINYDDQTLKDFEDILTDLDGVDRTKVKFHLERIWQTKPTPSNPLLKNALDLAMSNGFSVSYLNFFRKHYACKADRLNQATILYDGSVYKCSGRDFKFNERDGDLENNGTISWMDDKITYRVGLSTFENEMCLNCKFLPICMGPCSQKSIEKKWENLDQICELNKLELSMEDFLIYRYNNLQNVKKIHHK